MAVDTTRFDVSQQASRAILRADDEHRVIRTWLYIVTAMVFTIVVIGGATRLTDSGLSITEWQPIMGALPPLSEADWQESFDKYKTTTEYQQVNSGMSMAEYRVIFWWEWGHRQLGRLIGLALLLPLIGFWLSGRLQGPLKWRILALTALVGAQGALGWYMVKSGLAERTDVSQYRLAAHLGLATIIFAYIWWLVLSLKPKQDTAGEPLPAWVLPAGVAMIVFVYAQIILGAFVAGMRAGLVHNTWPLMDGQFIPDGLFIMNPWWANLFENVMTVQFNHRMMAYAVVIAAIVYAVALTRSTANKAVRSSAGLFGLTILAQLVTGIVTLLWQVPIGLGLLHQGLAMIVLAAIIYHVHQIRRAPRFEFA